MMQQQRHAPRSRSLMEWVILWFNSFLGFFMWCGIRTMLNRLISTDSSLEEKLNILSYCLMTLSLWSGVFFLLRHAYAIAQKLELLASISGMVSVVLFAYYCWKLHLSLDPKYFVFHGSIFLFACLLAWAARWLGQLAESER